MSANKKARILGPDGKPYVAPPKPPAPTPVPKTDGGSVMPYSFFVNHTDWSAQIGRLFGLDIGTTHTVTPKPELRAAVANQVEELTADFEGEGGEELPALPRDLTTYRDAFASAAAKCDHRDAVEVMFGRQWICDTCHRNLGREDMRKARWSRFGL